MAKTFVEPPPPKSRMYQKAWEAIRSQADGAPVTIDCPPQNQARLIQAIKKEKAIANRLRKHVDAVGYGKLVITRVPGEPRKLQFHLIFNGDNI